MLVVVNVPEVETTKQTKSKKKKKKRLKLLESLALGRDRSADNSTVLFYLPLPPARSLIFVISIEQMFLKLPNGIMGFGD